MQLAGRAGVPAAGVTAVAVNVKATNPTAAGYLKVYTAGLAPGVDEDGRVYYDAGDTIGNTVIVPVSAEGQIAAEATGGSVDVVIDVQGWFGTGTSTTSSYVYDGDGTRRAKTTDTGLTTFAWTQTGGLPLLLTESSDAGTLSYIYGPGGLPVAQIAPDGTTHYLRHDQVGSTRLLTDQAGDVAGTYTYEAFGRQAAHTGAATTKLGYAGQYTDPETGYQYLRARYYDPTTGQFLTRDPIEPLTRSAYAYVGGNPTNTTDPSGLWCAFGENPNGSCRGSGAAGDARNAVEEAAQRFENARQDVADIDLGEFDWGTAAAGSLNVSWGAFKMYQGGAAIVLGTASLPFFDPLSGVPAYAYGGYQTVTGACKTARGGTQLLGLEKVDRNKDQRLGSNLSRFVEGVLPSTERVQDFIGGLP